MKLKSIRLQDFKRFSNLSISNIPETTKLVLLTGPNGSGKTSVFEAFNYWMGFARRQNHFDAEYHVRASAGVVCEASAVLNKIALEFYGITDNAQQSSAYNRKAFYVRPAYRHEPDFTSNGISKADEMLADSRRAGKLIQSEARVSENYQRIVGESILALYNPEQQDRTAAEITNELIGQVREAMKEVFGDLFLEGPGDPMTNGTFRFRKGTSSGFHYKNLSGGEKAAFDLLLDFIVKRRAFDDTIYCIDEPELHMHTHLQAKLLAGLFERIPDRCQLWISTHSIGMARKAAELNARYPGQVAFIDFHDYDPDQTVNLTPVNPDRNFWKNMFATALDDLAELVVPAKVVFCEGKRLGTGGRKPAFDAAVYSQIFAKQHPDADFVSLGGTSQVERDGDIGALLLKKLAPGIQTWKVFKVADEIEIIELRGAGVKVLVKRDLESYLWDDEILQKLASLNNQSDKAEELKNKKAALLNELPGKGKPIDDIKAISGDLYNFCKTTLSIIQCGNDAEAFARLTLAPLVTPDTKVYCELEEIIFSQITAPHTT